MSDKPLRAKITSVLTDSSEDIHIDTILVNYEDGEKTVKGEFTSPFLNTENLMLWRRVVLGAVLRQKAEANDDRISDFSKYKSALELKEVFVANDSGEIYGIGKDADNLFIPEAYGIVNEDAFDDLDDDDTPAPAKK